MRKQKVGKYKPNIKTNKKKLKQKFEVAKKWLHENMHKSPLEVGLSIRKKIIGHYAYYGINGNYSRLAKYYKYLKYTWYYTLRKRGQKNKIKYLDYLRIWNYLEIPAPKIYVNIW